MAERRPLVGDSAATVVEEIDDGDVLAPQWLPANVLYTSAANVPSTPTVGLESTNVQSALTEIASRFAGGRRISYVPYTVERRVERVGRIHRVGSWLAGAYDGSEILDTHGTWGHQYPFGTFAAYNERGAPHRDHDRLATLGGQDLVTTVSATTLAAVKTGAGFGRFDMGVGTWAAEAYQVGKWVFPLGWSNAGNNGRFLVSTVDAVAGQLLVEDPGDKIVTEASAANHEVRGTTSGASGHNGYASGLLILQGALDMEERVHMRASGLLENTINADAFVEIVVEPNPPLDIVGTSQFTGANRMRMNTGSLGATWTGKKRIVWDYTLQLGHSNLGTEYSYDWRIDVQDVLSVGGSVNVTGGFNFKETAETTLCPRFRVDRAANLDIYDATFQALSTLKLEFQKLDAGAIH